MASLVPDRGSDPKRRPKHTLADMMVDVTTGVNSGAYRVSSLKSDEPSKMYMGYTKKEAIRKHRDYLNGKG
jgi:hypothetical protein